MQQIFDSNLAMQDLPFLRWRPPCPTNFHMLKLILRASKNTFNFRSRDSPCVSMRVIGHGLPPFVGFFVTSEPFHAFGISLSVITGTHIS